MLFLLFFIFIILWHVTGFFLVCCGYFLIPPFQRTLIPSQRETARRGRKALRVRMAFIALTLSMPIISNTSIMMEI